MGKLIFSITQLHILKNLEISNLNNFQLKSQGILKKQLFGPKILTNHFVFNSLHVRIHNLILCHRQHY